MKTLTIIFASSLLALGFVTSNALANISVNNKCNQGLDLTAESVDIIPLCVDVQSAHAHEGGTTTLKTKKCSTYSVQLGYSLGINGCSKVPSTGHVEFRNDGAGGSCDCHKVS